MTLTEQIRCVEREIKMRQRVYPGLVDRRKLGAKDAERELLTMGRVLETLVQCQQLADCLDKAERCQHGGMAGVDQPEGTVYIHISDTLAKRLAAQLRGEPNGRPSTATNDVRPSGIGTA
jgi:hypothetical protein